MDLRIYINNQDVSHIVDGNVNINNAVNGGGASVGFVYHFDTDQEAPNIRDGDRVRIEYSDGSLVFSGAIDTITKGTNARDNRMDVVCLDNTYLLKKVSVDKKVYVNSTVNEILNDLLTPIGLKAESTNNAIIPRITFNRSNLRDVVYKLARSQAADWYIEGDILKFIFTDDSAYGTPARTSDFDITLYSGDTYRNACFSWGKTLHTVHNRSGGGFVIRSYSSAGTRVSDFSTFTGETATIRGASLDSTTGWAYIVAVESSVTYIYRAQIDFADNGSISFLTRDTIKGSIPSITSPGCILYRDGKVYIGDISAQKMKAFTVGKNLTNQTVYTADTASDVDLPFAPYGATKASGLIYIGERGGSRRCIAFRDSNFSRVSDFDFTQDSSVLLGGVAGTSRSIFLLSWNSTSALAYSLPNIGIVRNTLELHGSTDIIRGSFKESELATPPYGNVSVVGETGETLETISTKITVPTISGTDFFFQTGIRFRQLDAVVKDIDNTNLSVGVYGLDNEDTTKKLLWSQSGGFLAPGAGYNSGDLTSQDVLTLTGRSEYRFRGEATVPLDSYRSNLDVGDYYPTGSLTTFDSAQSHNATDVTFQGQSDVIPLRDYDVSGVFETRTVLNGSVFEAKKDLSSLRFRVTVNLTYGIGFQLRYLDGADPTNPYTDGEQYGDTFNSAGSPQSITIDETIANVPQGRRYWFVGTGTYWNTGGGGGGNGYPIIDRWVQISGSYIGDPVYTNVTTARYKQDNQTDYLASVGRPLIVSGQPMQISDITLASDDFPSSTSNTRVYFLKMSDDFRLEYPSGGSAGYEFTSVVSATRATISSVSTVQSGKKIVITPITVDEGAYIVLIQQRVSSGTFPTIRQTTVTTRRTLLSVNVGSNKTDHVSGDAGYDYWDSGANYGSLVEANIITQSSSHSGGLVTLGFTPLLIRARSVPDTGLVYYTYAPVSSDEVAEIAATRIASRLKNNKKSASFRIHNNATDKIYLAQKYRIGSSFVYKTPNRSGALIDTNFMIRSVSYTNRSGYEEMTVSLESERYDNMDDVLTDLVQNYSEGE